MRIRQKELRQRKHRKEQRIKAGTKGPAITGAGVPRPAAPARPAAGGSARTGSSRPASGGGSARPNRPARTEA